MKTIVLFLCFALCLFFSFSQSGANDPTFNTLDDGTYGDGLGFNDLVRSTSIQSDGKIIVGGFFTSFNDTTINRIARLNSNGSLDASFDPGTGFNSAVYSTSIHSDGKIIMGGTFTSFNGMARSKIARLNSDGSLDTSFDPGTGLNDYIQSISIQSDGKIIVGGNFTSFNGTTINRIARLNSNGSLDTSFDPGTGFNDVIYSISIQSDAKIIVGGRFTSFNGAPINRIVRLNSDGSLDTSFNLGTGFDNTIYSTPIQSDGKILVGGSFHSFNGMARRGIARLNSDGSLDASFNPGTGFNSLVYSTPIQSDGKIIVGGFSTSFNGMAINRIVRLNSDGSLDPSFDPGTGFNDAVYSISIQSDAKIIVGGLFTSFNGIVRNHIARLSNCTSPAMGTDVISSCIPYTWIDGIEYTTSNNTAIFTMPNGSENGCDSLVTLHLTINSVDATASLNGITLTANLSGASYQWIDCDDNDLPIAGETAQTYTAFQNGNYAVIVSNGICQDTSVCIVVNTVGIVSLNQHGWKIYPNPTSGVFTVSSNQLLDNALVEIHSIDGKLIYSTVFSGTEMSFNIGNNSPGVYIMRVDNKDTFRMVKN